MVTAEATLLTDRSDWKTVRFGDVVENVNVQEREPLENGLTRYVGLEHLSPDSLRIQGWGDIADGTSFTKKFVPGQVLFPKRRVYQRKFAYADFEGLCSGDILVFQPKHDELVPELLPFLVQTESFVAHALDTSAGSLSPRTRWRDLASYEFALPPQNMQVRLANLLWAAEQAIKGMRKSSDAARRLLGAMFSEGLLQVTGKSMKATTYGSVPAEWSFAAAEEFLVSGPTNGFSPPGIIARERLSHAQSQCHPRRQGDPEGPYEACRGRS